MDLLKLVMAIFVVAVHTNAMANCHNLLLLNFCDSVFRLSVPFFFLASGFFLMQRLKDTNDVEKLQSLILNSLKKTVKLYLLASLIYMPLALYYFSINRFSLIQSIVSYLRGLLLLGENYNSWMLWYLLSMIYALIFVFILLRLRVKFSSIVFLGVLVYLLGASITEFVGYQGPLPRLLLIVQRIISITIRNGRIFTGFIYIPMGMLLAKKHVSLGLSVFITLLGLSINVFFGGLIGELALSISSVGVFIISTKIRLKDHAVYPAMRTMSTVVYFAHMYAWTVYYSLVYHRRTWGFDSFVATIFICMVIGLAVVLFKKEKSAKISAN